MLEKLKISYLNRSHLLLNQSHTKEYQVRKYHTFARILSCLAVNWLVNLLILFRRLISCTISVIVIWHCVSCAMKNPFFGTLAFLVSQKLINFKHQNDIEIILAREYFSPSCLNKIHRNKIFKLKIISIINTGFQIECWA